MQQTEILNIRRQVKANYEGVAWHGSSLKENLEGITTKQAFQRPLPSFHNIAELVVHLINWRNFVIQKLQGNADFSIELDTSADWAVLNEESEEVWQNALERLEKSQETLLALLKNTEDQILSQKVKSNQAEHTYYVMLHGIIQHDTYHNGQIALLKKWQLSF